MSGQQKPHNLQEVLDRVEEASDGEREVSLEEILDRFGPSTFAPFILLAGLIMAAPLVGDIPGVPTLMGIFILLTAGQLLIGRNRFWLPQWMLEWKVKTDRVDKALAWMRRPAQFVDRFPHPRLKVVTGKAGTLATAAACVMIALATPLMEVVLFAANVAGFTVILFGLALITRDGLIALLAFLFTMGTFGFLAYMLL